VLTTDQKGVIAEQAIAWAAIQAGLGVCLPLGDERYDLILDLRPTLLRVQCKWAVFTKGVVQIRTRRCRRGREGLIHRYYEPGAIDVIAAYCNELDRCYLLPTDLSVGRAAVQLRVTPTLNNQQRRIHWAQDFEFGATIERLKGPIAQLGERYLGMVEVAGSSPAGSTSHLSPTQTR
jgi:PD-(D/E)XK endonuclease